MSVRRRTPTRAGSALRRHHPKARHIHLVLDNYSIHSSRRLQVYLKKHGDLFQLHFLPPYCPDHNKIERLWRELHANVTRNHRHPTIEGLMCDGVWPWLKAEAKRRRQGAACSRRRGQNLKVA